MPTPGMKIVAVTKIHENLPKKLRDLLCESLANLDAHINNKVTRFETADRQQICNAKSLLDLLRDRVDIKTNGSGSNRCNFTALAGWIWNR